MTGIDEIGMACRQFASGIAIARLRDDRSTLRGRRQIGSASNVEMFRVCHEIAALPDRARCVDELPCALISFGKRQVIATPEIRAGKSAGRGDDVPAGTALRQRVERRKLACQRIRLVECRGQRTDQADILGNGCQGRQDRQRVGAADHVEFMETPFLLAHAQTLSQKNEIEFPAFDGFGKMPER
ncbi:hypothetical protein D3C73_835770 [compost metagenome]